MILRQITKEKGHQVWDSANEFQYWEKRSLYDSLPLTMNRVAKQSRKALKEDIDGDNIDIGYHIGNEGGLFELENDLKMVLWDIYCKINHIPTRNKIISRIDFLCGQEFDEDVVENFFYRKNHSLFEKVINDTVGYHWADEKNDYDYYDRIIDNQTLFDLQKLGIKEKMEFCITEYRKTIKFIQKCLNENDIKCEIIGDCYLDSNF